MQPCPTGVSGERDDRHHPLQRWPSQPAPLRHRFRRQRRLHHRPTGRLIDNNPPAHPRRPCLDRRRRLAARQRLRPLLGESRPGVRPARSAAPTGGSPARPVSTPGSSSAAGRDIAALADRTVPAARRLSTFASGCVTKRATPMRRLGGRGAAALRRRRPRRCLRGESDAGRTELPETVSAEVSDAHSGPAKGEIHYRRLGSRALDRAADQTSARRRRRAGASGRRSARGPRSGHLRLPCRRGGRRPATKPRPRVAPTAPRWRCARRRRRTRPRGGRRGRSGHGRRPASSPG